MSMDWSCLGAALDGAVVLPEDAGYATVRRQFVAAPADVLPAAVVRCTGPADVAAALAFARSRALPFAVRSGGHCFAGHSSTPGLLIDVGALDAVTFDGGIATVGPGATTGEVASRLLAAGRWLPSGSCPTVGIGGIALVGGFGLLGRRYGLTADHLIAAEVVLADGTRVRADAGSEPALFWALRGAGAGNFGVVTSLSFTTRPVTPLYVFYAVWPAEHAVAIIDRWQRLAPEASDAITAELMLAAVDLPDIPPVVRIFGNILADSIDAAARLLSGFVHAVGTDPDRAGVRAPEPAAATRYLAGYARWTGDEVGIARGPFDQTGFQATRSEFFDRLLPAPTIQTLIDVLGHDRTEGEYRELEFVPWQGAYRQPASATAFVHREPRFLVRHTVQAGPPTAAAQRDAARRWLDRSWRTTRPHGTGHVYQGYPDPELSGWENAYYGANLKELRRIKAAYDPGNVFVHAQSITAAPE
jgi:FAD/FMN-containing dehydrogenase